MEETLNRLIGEILERAREQGLDQKRLLRRAGLGPTTLSKMKRAGDARLSTVERLANTVGLTLSLSPREPALEKILRRDLFGGE